MIQIHQVTHVISSLALIMMLAIMPSLLMADNDQFHFIPIDNSANTAHWDARAPWKLPKGFTQSLIADESAYNIYDAGRNDWNDMNTVNETGPLAGRFLYRTHEVYKQAEGGAVSVIDLKTGVVHLLAQQSDWNAVDGIEWTPWGTLLINEEKKNGRVFEIILDPKDPSRAIKIEPRLQIGLLAHEGIQVGPDGAVYVVDEFRGLTSPCGSVSPCGGGIYKFVPDKAGDLSTGKLFVLKTDGPDGTGKAEWRGPIDPMNARISGSQSGGTSYQRPEDLQFIGNTLYAAITEGSPSANGRTYAGRVIAINLDDMLVSDFIKPGMNVPAEIGKPEDSTFQTGFASPDNLAMLPDGRLIVIEDNVPSDIWVASNNVSPSGASTRVELFASLSDPKAEGTGIYVNPLDPNTLYVNVQHSKAVEGDATWAIHKISAMPEHK